MKQFIIEQKITPLANQYRVYEADAQGARSDIVAFAHQKRLALKEKITLYTDEKKNTILTEVQARKVMDFGARYDVTNEKRETLGIIGKAFGASLLRSTWHVYTPGHEDAPLIVVQERNVALAIIRRVWELIPVIGEIPFFVKYHFDFIDSKTGRVIGRYNKQTTFRDNYLLQVEGDAPIDWRVLIALGVMMDALQSR